MLRKSPGMGHHVSERSPKRPRTYKPILEVLEGRLLLTAPTLQISAPGGVFNGSAYAAIATVADTSGDSGPSLEGVSPTLTYFAGASATGTALTGAPSGVGVYTVVAFFPGSADYDPASASATFTISQASPTVQVSDAGGIFDSLGFAANATVAGVDGQAGASLDGVSPLLTYFAGTSIAGTGLSAAPADAGTYTVVAYFPGSPDYASAISSTTFMIGPAIYLATPTLAVVAAGGQFNGSAFPASATIVGVGADNVPSSGLEGESLTLTYHEGSGATGTVLPGPPVNAGTYKVVASFAGSTDYHATSASATFTIGQATPSVLVSDSGGIANGTAYAAIATVAGIDGVFSNALAGVSPSLTYFAGPSASGSALAGAPVNAGTYTVMATYPGSTNYGSTSVTDTFSISDATPTVQVSDGGGTFNGSAFAATAMVGVNGNLGASLEGVSPISTYYRGASAGGTPLGSAPVSVGTYTVLASFAGSTDYTAASATATFTITKATPTVQVSDGSGIFNGTAFAASATVAGINGAGVSLEGVSPTLTYYVGSSASGTPSSSAPVNVGTYTVLASFAGSTDFTAASATTTFTIAKATPIVQVSDGGGIYSGTAFTASATVAGINGSGISLEGATPSLTYYVGSSASGTPSSSAPVNVGTYTVLASFNGSTDYLAASSTATFSIAKATPTVQVSDGGGIFNGAAFTASATVAGINGASISLEGATPSLTYFVGSSASGTPSSSAPVNVGTYTVLASFTGSTDYTAASSTATFTIAKATPTVQVSDGGGIFNGAAFTVSATVAGINGASISLEGATPSLTYFVGSSASGTPSSSAPVNVGTYTVLASFTGSTDYTAASSTATFTIAKATPTVQVSDGGGIFNGAAFTASATVAGINGASISLEGATPSLTYFVGSSASGTPSSSAPVNVGTYTVLASFTGSTDYTAASSTATFTIAKATPTVQVSDGGGIFNGAAFTASATVAGINGASISLEGATPSLTYYVGSSVNGTPSASAPASFGTYTVLASFKGSTDYMAASATATFTIAKATPIVQVSDSGGVYNGLAFTATATAAGINGASVSLEGVSPNLTYFVGSNVNSTPSSSAPVNVGTYTVLASFTGSTDYMAASATATFTIAKATPTVQVSDSGGIFNGVAFTASATVTGINGSGVSLESASPSLTYYVGSSVNGTPSSSAPVNVGTYTVLASFAGSTDYLVARSTATFSIAKATPIVQVSDGGGIDNGSAFTASASVAGINGSGVSLEGVSLGLTYYVGSSASGTPSFSAPANVGTYTVLASFTGSTDYAAASAMATFTIAKATSTVQVSDGGGVFSGAAFTASAMVAGINGSGASLEGVSPTLTCFVGSSASGTPSSSAPINVGTYTVLASFVGSTNYLAASSTATFTITKATPTVQVSDGGGIFSRTAFVASATVAGVNGLSGVSLEGVSPSLTYYVGSSASGTSSSSAPVGVGTYSVLASFSGSTDYTAASATTTFTIAMATPTVQVSDGGGIFNGTAFTATATVTGINGSGVSLEGVSPTLTYYVGASASGTPSSSAPISDGTYTALASFIGSTDYTSASATATFTIGIVTPTVQVNDSGGIYNGTAFSATATVAGVNGIPGASLEGANPTLTYYPGAGASGIPSFSAPVNVGTYTVVAYFPGSTDYLPASATTTFTIIQAAATVQVSDGGGIFDGAAFPATAMVTDANGNSSAVLENVSPVLSYFAGSSASGTPSFSAPVTVGTYTVVAYFPGSTDYLPASATTTFTIIQAAATVQVSDDGGIFNGTAFPATATVTDVNGNSSAALENVSPVLSYFAGSSASGTPSFSAPVTVGTYTVVANFPGSTDYLPASATTTFTIIQAAATVQVSDGGGIFDGAAFPATAMVTDANGNSSAVLENVSPVLSYFAGSSASGTPSFSSPVTVGTYTVVAYFPGSTDYLPASATTTFTIIQAAATVQVSDGGGIFNGTAFPATATVTDVNGNSSAALENVSPVLSYFAGSSASGTPSFSAPVTVGTYTVVAYFPGSTDYLPASATATFTVTQAAATVQVSDDGGIFNGTAYPATAMVTDVDGNSSASLENVSPVLSYFAGSSASGTPSSSAPVSVGTYTVVANFPGSTDYSAASATATFTIIQAAPTVQVSDGGGIFNGTAFPATAMVTDVNGDFSASLENVSPVLTYYVGSSASGTPLAGAPVSAGVYTALASFGGSTDYAAVSATTTFTIDQATPTVQVSDENGAFTGSAFSAAATVAGLDGNPSPLLEGVAPSVTYYAGTNINGPPLTGAPVSAGSYTAVATFPGSGDYASASSMKAFIISVPSVRFTPKIIVSDAGGVFNGLAYPASATVAGSNGLAGPSLEGVAPSLAYFAGSTAVGTPLTAVPVNAGTYTAVASFPATTADYASAKASVTFTITRAVPTVQVSDAGGIYDGKPFPATALIAGITGQATSSLEGVSPSYTYYTGTAVSGKSSAIAPTTAGTYTVVATFAGSRDYGVASASTTFTIAPAMPTVRVSDNGGTYNAKGFTALATVAGLNGQFNASLENVAPKIVYYAGIAANGPGSSVAPITVGTYTAVATFAGSLDYVSATASVNFNITQAAPKLLVSDANGLFGAREFLATTSVAGVSNLYAANLENVAPTLTYYVGSIPSGIGSATAPSAVGTYTVVATFAGSLDYQSASATATFVIAKATPSLQVIDNSGTGDGLPFVASTLIEGANSLVGSSLEGVSPTVTYYAGGIALTAAPINAGAYTAIASFAGSQDYGPVSASTSFIISPSVPAQVMVVAGNNQSARNDFGVPLQVVVTDPFNNPVPNAQVTFTIVPGVNAVTGLFDVPLGFNGLYDSYYIASSTTVTTDAAGVATAPLLTTNGYQGAFTVVATVEGIGQLYSFVFTEYAF